ncbi:MAG: Hsp20/alpha crystallin family protein [Calditrichia bacterium]
MAIVRWRPGRDLLNMQDEMNRMFDRFFGSSLSEDQEMLSPAFWHPRVDIYETEDEYVVTAELPGMKREDIHISFNNGNVVIEGERKSEKEEKDVNYHRVERSRGKFSRSFQLPTKINQDKINASYKDGILEVHLPKAEEVKPKQIEVKVS